MNMVHLVEILHYELKVLFYIFFAVIKYFVYICIFIGRLAPLWPFIGILIQVVIMAVVISIYYFQDKKKVS